MQADVKRSKGYIIHKVTDNNYCVCRILNEYKSEEEARDALVGLLTSKKTEEELLEEYGEKF